MGSCLKSICCPFCIVCYRLIVCLSPFTPFLFPRAQVKWWSFCFLFNNFSVSLLFIFIDGCSKINIFIQIWNFVWHAFNCRSACTWCLTEHEKKLWCVAWKESCYEIKICYRNLWPAELLLKATCNQVFTPKNSAFLFSHFFCFH